MWYLSDFITVTMLLYEYKRVHYTYTFEKKSEWNIYDVPVRLLMGMHHVSGSAYDSNQTWSKSSYLSKISVN